ncbi:hypothetical protein DOTSEDRAFT_25794 [Dothistroma septosporum NZE10]|uniref:Uncharacterized protein n=1 Tax=Dothistroma septosporum (strain NZE10 / CBS 128990) TaxID=675120 RepID=N1PHS3_DOTSN|nr:hypothetical protein DOTSEDRAFT_25794 [Dothistroma septosporum NZE10]
MDPTRQNMTQSNAPANAGLICLPGELHDMVCGFIKDTKSLGSLRDSCRILRKKTQDIYQKQMYSTLKINLTVEDLEYVGKVSQHEQYSPLVQRIVITPAFLDRITCRDGRDITLMKKGLRNLENLRAIDILPYETGGNVLLRARANALVPKFGDPHYIPQVVVRHDPTLVHDPISHTFSVVREALHCSKSVVHLTAGATPSTSSGRNSVDHASFQTTTARTDNSSAQLESLHLVTSANGSSLNIEVNLANLLRPMLKLKSLRLEFWGYNVQWLSKIFEDVTFPDLKQLSIQAARKVKASALGGFIQRHKITLESLELSVITFIDDDLATTFPTIFQGLQLHKLKLSQLVSAPYGLLLLGTTCEIICNACYKDLDAAWMFKQGPHCDHASCNVTGGEMAVSRELARRFEIVGLLPWPARPPRLVSVPIAEAIGNEVEESASEDVVMEDQTTSSADATSTPTIVPPYNISSSANLLPARDVAGASEMVTGRAAAAGAPSHTRGDPFLYTRSDPAPSRAPVSTGVIDHTIDSDEGDGPYDGYKDYGGEIKVQSKGTLSLPLETSWNRPTVVPMQSNFTTAKAEARYENPGRGIGGSGPLRRRTGAPPTRHFGGSDDMVDEKGDEDDGYLMIVSEKPHLSEKKREESLEWSTQRGGASKSRRLIRELMD